MKVTLTAWRSCETRPGSLLFAGDSISDSCGNVASVSVTSAITALKAGSSTFFVFDWIRTSSLILSSFVGKPASMISSAFRASPTFVSAVSRFFVPTA